MHKKEQVHSFLDTIKILFFVQGRNFLFDFRSLFFVFGYPTILVVLVGVFFFKPNDHNPYLVFSGLTLMSCLIINLSLVAFQISDWRNSVLFTRIKVASISPARLLIAFVGFYSFLTVVAWLWTFALICLIVAVKSDAHHVANLIAGVSWWWQVLVLLLAGLSTLPVGLSLGFALNTAESIQFTSALVVTVMLSLGGTLFPLGLITHHSPALRYISYLLYFRYVINLNQIYWNGGQLPPVGVYNDGYRLWWLWVAITSFLVGFWMMFGVFAIRFYRRR